MSTKSFFSHGIELSGLQAGSTVAVIGPGPIGIMAMKISKALGAARVIVAGRGARLESAIRLGCDGMEIIRTLSPYCCQQPSPCRFRVYDHACRLLFDSPGVEEAGRQKMYVTCGELLAGGGEEIVVGTFLGLPTQPPTQHPAKIFQHNAGSYAQIWQQDPETTSRDVICLSIGDVNGNGQNELYVASERGLVAYESTPLTNTPPIITQPPTGTSSYVGGTVRLGVFAYGSWPLAYQWLKDGVRLERATNSIAVVAPAHHTNGRGSSSR